MMDTKITLSFDSEVINSAKEYAEGLGISLSRFTEILYRKVINSGHKNLENLPISDWVANVAEDHAEYITRKKSRKDQQKEFFEASRK